MGRYAIRTLACPSCGVTRIGHYPPSQRYCSRACRWPRHLVVDGDRLAIPLFSRRGDVVAHALISEVDIGQARYRWHRSKQGYAARRSARGIVLLHRELLGLEPGDPRQGDHVDGNRLDYRRRNLRVVTRGQNGQNVEQRGASRFRGVCWHKGAGKWMAYAEGNGRSRKHLGLYEREEDAAHAASEWRAANLTHSVEARHVA